MHANIVAYVFCCKK